VIEMPHKKRVMSARLAIIVQSSAVIGNRRAIVGAASRNRSRLSAREQLASPQVYRIGVTRRTNA
jgi:hypothetical protein